MIDWGEYKTIQIYRRTYGSINQQLVPEEKSGSYHIYIDTKYWLITKKDTQQKYFIKEYLKNFKKARCEFNLINQIRKNQKLAPFVVNAIGIDDGKLLLEYIDGISLFSKGLSVERRNKAIKKVLAFIDEISKPSMNLFSYFEIHPNNILIKKNDEVKFVDFENLGCPSSNLYKRNVMILKKLVRQGELK